MSGRARKVLGEALGLSDEVESATGVKSVRVEPLAPSVANGRSSPKGSLET